ncbi:tetraspanin family protein [Teladorsagia circumcincta]|uniref:Tetraspanin family protein n=1 Tax=Teladorsagia circumcincta TaxID=45464 RepID=A0A2G9U3G1_TELCI|nr:tetraspanin family protein [Teladorsagia circumcincta]
MGDLRDGSYERPIRGKKQYVSVHDRGPFYEKPYPPSSRSETSENDELSCFSWLKYGIFATNIVLLVVGGLLLTMGVWLRTDSRFRDFISERYRQAVGEAFWEAPTLYAFSYIIIVLGCCMIVISFLGCCVGNGGNRAVLICYAVALFLLLLGTLSCGIYLFYKKDAVDVELSDALNYMVQHYYQGAGVVQESLDHLQTTFRCCGTAPSEPRTRPLFRMFVKGNAGCADFRAFRQDPPRSCDIRCDGCHYRIWVALSIGLSVTLVVFSAVIVCIVLALVFSLYILFSQPKQIRVVDVVRRRVAKPTLRKEAIQRHNLSYDLRKH